MLGDLPTGGCDPPLDAGLLGHLGTLLDWLLDRVL